MTRRLAALALTAALLAGCQVLDPGPPVARGDTEEILVATDSATWAGPVGEALRAELAEPVATLPSNQGAFKLRLVPITSRTFGMLKRSPAVVFAGAVDAEGEIGDFLRARVGEGNLAAVREGRTAAVNVREDLWSLDQIVTIATAASDSALAAQILRRGPELRAAYHALALKRLTDEMFAKARQTDKEADLLDAHGFRVAIQHDFVQTEDTTVTAAGVTGTFVRYRRVLAQTWRDFFVFAVDGVDTVPPPDAIDAITNDLLRQFARGSIDSSYVQLEASRPMSRDTVEIAGRPAQEQRGLWQTTVVPMGGAYIRYAFVDPATDRLYIYYGMTFAPDRRLDKRKFLRQMEAIGHTFRTQADADREAAASHPPA